MVALCLVLREVTSLGQRAPVFPPSFGPIADADPTKREEREVRVPTGFRAVRTADELAVCADTGPLEPVKLQVGHKMVLGMRRKFYIYREGTARPAQPYYEELGGLLDKASNLPQFYKAEPFGFIQRGKPYVAEFEIAVFETDIPGQHMWSPESGKYKVLWHATLRAVPKEEAAFPADILKWKADMERIKPQPVPPPEIPADFLRTSSEDWKRILATKITAGFQYAPIGDVVPYMNAQTDALYWIGNYTGYRVEWELQQGSPVGIVITDE
jgi:hypothetical protein